MTRKYISLLIILLSLGQGYGQISPVGFLLRLNGQFELVTEAALLKPTGIADSLYLFNVIMNGDSIKTSRYDVEINRLAVNWFMPPTIIRESDPAFVPEITDLNHLKDVWDYRGILPDSVKKALPAEIRKRVPEPGMLNIRGGRRFSQIYFIDGQPIKSNELTYPINRLVFYGYSKGKLATVLSFDGASGETAFDSLVYVKGLLSEMYRKNSGSARTMTIAYNNKNKVRSVQTSELVNRGFKQEISSFTINYTFAYDGNGNISAITETSNGSSHTMGIRKY